MRKSFAKVLLNAGKGRDPRRGKLRESAGEGKRQGSGDGASASEAVGAFVQSYGSKHLDASALLLPLVGFLPAHDERVRSTVEAIERHLVHDGLVHRYDSEAGVDGLPPGEGAFLACSFWLAQNLVLLDRRREALTLFGRLLSLRNDVGLLSEQYDPKTLRLLGNFPQALSHMR